MSTALAQPAQAPALAELAATLADRWQRASERATVANVIVTAHDDLGNYTVTSASHPGVAYLSDGVGCTCQAAQMGDVVCLHRAAVRDYQAQQTRCTVCGGSGWEHVSIWDWKTGRAMDLYSIRCRCQDTEPEPPAPALVMVPALDRELADAMADLDRNHAQLDRLNEKMDRQGWLNDRDFRALSYEGDRNADIHDRIRRIKAQMSAQNVQVAA